MANQRYGDFAALEIRAGKTVRRLLMIGPDRKGAFDFARTIEAHRGVP
ncbi:MAG: hypothetical protein GX044_05670 [Firmicutes bacterium]|nr:hypothetical protein [Bacillota bacterium]